MYQELNDKLIQSFLEHTFYKGFRRTDERYINYSTLELILNYKCINSCVYCYVNRYGRQLYPPEIQDDETILRNTELICDWIIANSFKPRLEVFSGDPLTQEIGFKVLDVLLSKFRQYNGMEIVVPTSFAFILSDKLTERVDELLERSRRENNPIYLSASIDGKYCEANRPLKLVNKGEFLITKKDRGEPRDDSYYDKVFSFASKWDIGFHPMIYSKLIDKWIDNFLWFQSMMRKYNIPFYQLYLLEVRNEEWDDNQIRHFRKLIDFLIKWLWDYSGRNIKAYTDLLFKGRGFNILSNPFTQIGRGIGCSIQSTLPIRLGDLAIPTCHRTAYPHQIVARMKVQDNKIVGIEALNPELMIATYSFDSNTFPYCEQCILKNLCSKGCLGSQYESTGDMYTPIQTVCKLEYNKIVQMIKSYKELGILNQLMHYIPINKRESILTLMDVLKL